MAAPKSWPIRRKDEVFVTARSRTGHKMAMSMPLSMIFKDLLGLARTNREVRMVLQGKKVLVDGARRYRLNASAGFMDVISFLDVASAYRVFMDRQGRLFTYEIPQKEASLKLCKVSVKHSLGKSKEQIGFTDGRTVVVKDSSEFKIGDGVLMDLEKKEIREHIPLDRGALVMLTGGSHKGHLAQVSAIEGRIIHCQAEGVEFTTRRRYAFVLGKGKPAIAIPEGAA
ncbi:MAG: hypothetical protein HC945_02850 [Nitrosarchaeum sp.]|nr:hypothetical protein [Nitrosarchaeum sp.]